MVALFRAGHGAGAQKRRPEEGSAAALPGHGMPGSCPLQGDGASFILLHHVQGQQQLFRILILQG